MRSTTRQHDSARPSLRAAACAACALLVAGALAPGTTTRASATDPPTPRSAPPIPSAPQDRTTLSPRRVALAETAKKQAKKKNGAKSKPKSKAKKRKKPRFAKGSDAILRIKSIRIARYVYTGGQRTIDRQRVAHYTGWRDTFTKPGRSGVYWLAAHNYGTYGPFHPLLRIKKKARISVTTRSGKRYVYKVVRTRVVGTVVPKTTVWGKWGPRSGPARAVLQTCKGNKRLLVYAILVRS